jgi:trypsin
VGLAACSPPEGGVAPRRSAVVGGAPEAGDPAVVAILARRVECEGASPTLLCTGTLVSPRAVLAAAHCLDAFGPEGAYEIVFGPSVDGPGVYARRALAHPDYDAATHEHDLAVFELAGDAPAAPAALPGEGFALAADAPARVVGFGETRRPDQPAGVKRGGLTRVTTVTDGAFEAAPSPAMSCSGDSGGPVFVAGAAGEVLAGVTASGDAACKERAFNVRVDAHLDFITARLAEIAARPASAPSIAPGAVCAAACATGDDCPAGLRCESDFSGRKRCTLPGAGVGSLGAICQGDAGCGVGDRCVRAGDDLCACFHPCDAIGAPDPGIGGSGGSSGGGAAGPGGSSPAPNGEADGCALVRIPSPRGLAGWPFAAGLGLLRRRSSRRGRALRGRTLPRRARARGRCLRPSRRGTGRPAPPDRAE